MERMPFGKYKGRSINYLPTDYLKWLVTKADITSASLRDALHAEYRRRTAPPSKPPALHLFLDDTAREMLRVGFRTMAQQMHPDHGGSHEEMVKLNAAAERLRKAGLL